MSLALLVFCLLGAGVASAAPKGVSAFFPSSLGGGTAGGQFSSPRGVAVNSTGAGDADAGDIYVVDGSNNRVQVFSAAGSFKFAFGRDVVKPGGLGNVANNEVQRVTVSGATGGSFILLFSGDQGASAPIPFDASAATVQSALDQSPVLGAGNVSVSGPAGGPWSIEFVGTRAEADVAQLTASAGPGNHPINNALYGLTPSGNVSVETLSEGAAAVERCTVAVDCKAGLGGGRGGVVANPQGIAVDQSDGSVYVSERDNLRVQKFSADGSFERAWGKDVVAAGGAGDVPTPPIVVNERQQVALEGGFDWEVCFCPIPITGGSFTLTFGGQITGAIPFDASAAQVQAALEGLSNVDTVIVTGGPGPNSPWTVEFTGSLAGTNVAPMSIDFSGLTPPGGFGSVTTTQGGSTTSNGPAEVCTQASSCKQGLTGGTTLARGGEFTSTFTGYLAVAPAGAPNAGNVVVADPANRRVQEFNPNGGFVRAWGFDVVQPGAVTTFEVCTVATDCKTAASGGNAVGRFATNQPTRVAVDSTGATYTVENTGNFRVQKFDHPLAAPTVFAAGTLSGTGATSAPTDVAIGAGDNVLVSKQFPSGTGSPPVAVLGERRVLELDSAGGLLDTHAALAGLGFVQTGFISGVDGLAADPTTGKVFLAASSFMAPASTSASRVYVLDSVLPATGSLGVSAITSHGALLSGAVNPNGPDIPFGVQTSYRVEVSEDGVSWATLVPDSNIGQGTEAIGFSVQMNDLKADTLYQSRMSIGKQFNPRVTIPGPTFATPASRPDVQVLSPTAREATSATLNARINPNGSATDYRFEYGPTVAYGNTVPIPDGSAGAASVASVVSQAISGLEPATTYHFRVVASNATGTATSADRTFTTRAAVQPPDGRVYELVSPADKIGGVGVGFWGTTPARLAGSGVAAYTGERFAVGGNFGSALDGNSKHGFTNDWAFAQRDGDQAGWRSRSPITHPNHQPTLGQYIGINSVSEDLSRFSISGNNTSPTIFPEMGTDPRWPSFNTSFFLDWGSPEVPSRWELLGPASLDQIAASLRSKNTPWALAFSADGSALLAQTDFDSVPGAPARAAIYGLAGEGDPTWPAFDDLVSGRSIYLADTSGPPADSFAGTGTRELVNVCTGEGGDRTVLPGVQGNGLMGPVECLAPDAGRDWRLISEYGAALVADTSNPSLGGTISADGSRVFFMSPDPLAEGAPNDAGQPCAGTGTDTVCPPQLYVRQKNSNGSTTTRWISKAEPSLFGTQSASLTGAVRFEGSTPDGNRVFFRTTSPLTEDDPNGLGAPLPGGVKTGTPNPASSDLYMYEFPADPNADIGDGTLTRISSGPQADGDCNSPLPGGHDNSTATALRFASDDGKRVYFVCTAPLPGVPGVSNGSILSPGGTPSTADQTNLYLYDEHLPAAQRWRFVTRLPRAAAGSQDSLSSCASTGAARRSFLTAEGGNVGDPLTTQGSQANCVNGNSDGSFITLFTSGRLTADDPAGPATGDIYGYDAAIDELQRITAVRGGAGGTYLCAPGKVGNTSPTDTALCHGDGGVGNTTNVPPGQGAVINSDLGLVTDPAMPGDRIAFFMSAVQLVAEDQDSGYDVYQWRNGELSLISSGASDSNHAMYKGNSADGQNVYFATRDSLTWQDHDAVADVYTARVGNGVVEPAEPVFCDALAGGCQAGGGAGSVAAVPETSSGLSGQGDARVGKRRTVALAKPSARALRRASRTGVLALRVRSNRAGRVGVVANARLGRRVRRVGRASKTLSSAGMVTVRVKLNAAARKQLQQGRKLSLSVRLSAPGARQKSVTVVLRRAAK